MAINLRVDRRVDRQGDRQNAMRIERWFQQLRLLRLGSPDRKALTQRDVRTQFKVRIAKLAVSADVVPAAELYKTADTPR